MKDWSNQLHFSFTSRFIEVVYRFELKFAGDDVLKVDFAYYPYRRMKKSLFIDGLWIDSLFDMAVNKLNTLSQRMSVKDFVDCYFIWKKESFYDLIYGVEYKFQEKYDPLMLASDFLSVESFDTLPKMIKPLTYAS